MSTGLQRLLKVYTVLATVIGVFLVVLVLIGLPLHHLHSIHDSWLPVGSSGEKLGGWISAVLGTLHGFLYMGFLAVAFALSRMAKWPLAFTIVTLLCGTIPILSFWAERRATRRTRQLAAETATGASPPVA